MFQTYLVDMFACIDQGQLHFICTQQPKLHVTLLNRIEDVLSMNDNNIDLNQLGQHIILLYTDHATQSPNTTKQTNTPNYICNIQPPSLLLAST